MNTPETQSGGSLKPVGSEITDTQRLTWLIKQGPPGAAQGIALNEEAWEMAYIQPEGPDQSVMRDAIDDAMFPNTKLSGGGPLSNKTTEAESRRPLE